MRTSVRLCARSLSASTPSSTAHSNVRRSRPPGRLFFCFSARRFDADPAIARGSSPHRTHGQEPSVHPDSARRAARRTDARSVSPPSPRSGQTGGRRWRGRTRRCPPWPPGIGEVGLSRGERRDSNPRPPGPQPGKSGCAGGEFGSVGRFGLSSVVLTCPHLGPRLRPRSEPDHRPLGR